MDEIQEIIDAYQHLVLGIEKKAQIDKSRAYGGIIRAGKGKLVESISEHIVKLAWKKLGQPDNRLKIIRKEFKIPIKEEYVEKLRNEEVKNYIKKKIEDKIEDYSYRLTPDRTILIDDKPVMAIECKAYTENAMLKRILVDFTLLKVVHPNITPVLLQLESQLGGDYAELKKVSFGSSSTHTLLSYFDVDLRIITLLKGERKVDKPIHKKEFFKELTRESLENAVNIISDVLKDYV